MRRDRKAALHRLLGQQARGDHHRWVRGIGARRNRGDDGRAVRDRDLVTVEFDRHLVLLVEIMPVWMRRVLLDMFDLSLRAAFSGPAEIAPPGPGHGANLLVEGRLERGPEGLFHGAQRHTVLGTARPGQARLDGRQVKLEQGVEDWIGRLVRAEESLLLAVRLDQLDKLIWAASTTQVVERFVIHGEEAARSAVFLRHSGDGGAIGQAQVAQPGAAEFYELADDALAPQ